MGKALDAGQRKTACDHLGKPRMEAGGEGKSCLQAMMAGEPAERAFGCNVDAIGPGRIDETVQRRSARPAPAGFQGR